MKVREKMKKLITILLMLTMTMALIGCAEEVEVAEEKTIDVAADTKSDDKKEAADDKTEATAEQAEEKTEAVEEEPASPNLYPDYIIDETDTTVTFIDTFGTETTVTKHPEKVVTLYNSHLGLWYFMGGSSLTKVKGSSNVPEGVEFTDLGSSYSVSLEAVIAMEPTLVIMASNVSTQVEMAPALKEMGIETMLIDGKTKSFERFEENAYLFSKINGTEAVYLEKMIPINEKIEGIIATADNAENQPRVAPIFATSKSMSLESDIAQIGEIVSILGAQNIYAEEDLMAEGETRIPFSIEALVTQNPEVILISTMGKEEDAKATIDKMIEENPVWMEVDAVVNERVFYLPKDLSVYKPNERYAEAFLMVAELLYPELFVAE